MGRSRLSMAKGTERTDGLGRNILAFHLVDRIYSLLALANRSSSMLTEAGDTNPKDR